MAKPVELKLTNLDAHPHYKAAADKIADLKRRLAEAKAIADRPVTPEDQEAAIAKGAKELLATGKIARDLEAVAARKRQEAERREAQHYTPIIEAALEMAGATLEELKDKCSKEIAEAAGAKAWFQERARKFAGLVVAAQRGAEEFKAACEALREQFKQHGLSAYALPRGAHCDRHTFHVDRQAVYRHETITVDGSFQEVCGFIRRLIESGALSANDFPEI